MTTAFRQSAPFIKGQAAERLVATFLRDERGYHILPAYDYSGADGEKAPKIQGATEGIIVPDLGMAKAGSLKWAEVKYKWRPTFTRATRSLNHGIGRRKWCHYVRFQEKTGQRVWIFIVEGCSQKLLFERLDLLGPPNYIYRFDKMDPGGMVFWPRASFGSVVLNAIPGLFDTKIPLPFEQPE
jgi:hypothetical protein